MRSPLARERRRPAGFIVPCAPILSEIPPSGPLWLHEIKHDGYRITAHKRSDRVRLSSRNGRDWSKEFTAIAAALRSLRPDELILDGEACAHDSNGHPDFWEVRGTGERACLYAFDLLQLDDDDLLRRPLEDRKARLRRLIGRRKRVLQYVDHLEGDGAKVLQHACKLAWRGSSLSGGTCRTSPARAARG
jgi:bifunctional non-homologous end joining protein LigD